jgi:hypothetical protein
MLKNTYGLSVAISSKIHKDAKTIEIFAGSSLNRKPPVKNKPVITSEDLNGVEIQEVPEKPKIKKLRSMSQRTKQKIRKKVTAFSQAYEKLNFLTLTFVNRVEDRKAVAILGKFLDNCNKQLKDFQYIWVAERQTKNLTFPDNIHFHLITNKYFKIEKYWEYWIKLQERNGILPRKTTKHHHRSIFGV